MKSIHSLLKHTALATVLCALSGFTPATAHAHAYASPHRKPAKMFNRVAVFPVFHNTDIKTETVAEIVAASTDGNTLIYTDSNGNNAGFVDITDPTHPAALGIVGLAGEPTSVAVAGDYALVVINTSEDFINTSGQLVVIAIASQSVVASFPLKGQPDAIAVSPDLQYAAIAIENERDEELGDGAPPQSPAGFLQIVDLIGEPEQWSLREVHMQGVAELFPEDPEPEYVDINQDNIAAVTLQENNHIILVDLADGRMINDFSAGQVDLYDIDTQEEKPALILQDSFLYDVPREPDGITWVSNRLFVTANEGDLNGGSRGISLFNRRGTVKLDSGSFLEHTAARLGHYPDNRSENKGNEPENVEFARFGRFGQDRLLFAGSERSSLIFVYRMQGKHSRFLQALPAGVGPEGLLAIPQRNLFIAASEVDDRDDKIRSVLNIYQRSRGKARYPTLVSNNRGYYQGNTPIPWGAISGLAIDQQSDKTAYAVHDSFYQQSRIYKLNVKHKPAIIKKEVILHDRMGKLAAIEPALVNEEGTVNLDSEGIATRAEGGYWIAAEGDDEPVKFANLLVQVADNGDIQSVVTLPESVQQRMQRFGFEGVTRVGSGVDETLFVAFQREWLNDPAGHVRIGRYHVASGEWRFFYYPLETPVSDNGGWVGLSEITALGDDEFAVIERDNQAGPDAAIKRIYKFSVAGLTPMLDPSADETPTFPVVSKTLMHDLIADLRATGGLVLEKVEGLAFTRKGVALVINDNDGVNGSNGETQLLRVKIK